MIRPILIALASLFAFTACGSQEKAREEERIELEKNAQREAEIANKAITEMNRKMFGKRGATKKTNERLLLPNN